MCAIDSHLHVTNPPPLCEPPFHPLQAVGTQLAGHIHWFQQADNRGSEQLGVHARRRQANATYIACRPPCPTVSHVVKADSNFELAGHLQRSSERVDRISDLRLELGHNM
ncbi:MAG: hypothetical protein ACK56I_06975, partial [bacterium]